MGRYMNKIIVSSLAAASAAAIHLRQHRHNLSQTSNDIEGMMAQYQPLHDKLTATVDE